MLVFAFYGLVFVTLLLGTVFRPPVAMAAMLCLFGLDQWAQASSTFFTQYSFFTNILMASLVFLGLGIRMLKGERVFDHYPKVGVMIILLLLYCLLTYFWAYERGALVERMRMSAPYLVTNVLLLPLLIKNLADLRTAFLATLALGSVLAAMMLATGQWEGRLLRLADMSLRGGNPLAIAQMAGTFGLIAVLMNFSGINRFWQIVRWGVVLLAVILAVQSGSRGQFLLLVGLSALFLLPSRRPKNVGGWAIGGIAAVVVLALGMWAIGYAQVEQRFGMDAMIAAYEGGRVEAVRQVMNAWVTSNPFHIVFGLGNSASFSPEIHGYYPHVVPLEVLAEEGLVGFALYLAILIVTARVGFSLYWMTRHDREARGIVVALGALMVFEFMLTLKQGSLIHSQFFLVYPIIIGTLAISVRRQIEAMSEEERAAMEAAAELEEETEADHHDRGWGGYGGRLRTN